MITGLPMCHSYDAILMIIDCFSKEIIPVTCFMELSSEGWVKILHDEVYAKHGMPQVIISDWGTVFVSKFMKDLYKLLQIKSNALTAYHPQTDGQTEQVNQEVEKYLCIFINHLQDDWVEWLPLAEFSANSMFSETTGISPFFATYGFQPRLGVEPYDQTAMPASRDAESFAADMGRILDHLKAETSLAQSRYEEAANRRRQPAPKFSVG